MKRLTDIVQTCLTLPLATLNTLDWNQFLIVVNCIFQSNYTTDDLDTVFASIESSESSDCLSA